VVGEDHVDGQAEQQRPAGHAEGVEADAEIAEEPGSGHREGGEDPRRHDHGARGDPAPFRRVAARGQSHEQRGEADRLHHHEQGDEGAQGQAGHGGCRLTAPPPRR
jgi:hypothetical protein